jgi:beta-glucanase (GH16 family)
MRLFRLVGMALAIMLVPFGNFATPTNAAPSRTLLWHDEFSGKAGSPLAWRYDNGAGWDKGTLQTYTNRRANSWQNGAGQGIIRAKRETFADWDHVTKNYTSARISSAGRFSFSDTGVYVEIRAKFPTQLGTWPAFWTFSADGKSWPPEIDALEFAGPAYGPRGYLHTNLHYGNGKETGTAGWNYGRAPVVSNAETTYHTYGYYATSTRVVFYFDGHAIRTVTFARAQLWSQRHTIIVALALGSFGGNPSSSFNHADLVIDYVRAYNHP